MSRNYQVRLADCEVEEHGHLKANAPPIVPEMGEILSGELEKRGWGRAPGGKLQKGIGKVTATLDPQTGKIELQARETREVVGRGYDVADNDARGRAAARLDGEKKRGQIEVEARQAAMRAISEAEEAVRPEVRAAVDAATIEAVKRKAARMGQVESVTEGINAEGRPTLRIKVRI